MSRKPLVLLVILLTGCNAAKPSPSGDNSAEPASFRAGATTQPASLSLSKLAICRSVTQFGVYEPIEPARFAAGKEDSAIVYCEIDDFDSKMAGDSRWETRLSYEAVLRDDHGQSVITRKPTAVVDRCRNHRRDFFLTDRLTLPATLPTGNYTLTVTVTDQLAHCSAEKTVPVFVAAD